MDKYGLTFNGRHTSDFDVVVIDKKIGFPSKNKVLVTVPYSNTVYDFSSIFGDNTFDERKIEVTFSIIDRNRWNSEDMYDHWTKLVNWLMSTKGKAQLIDDVMSNYYYLGEVQGAPDFDEMRFHGKFKVTFQCYPFRIARTYAGDDEWNIFDFANGYSQYSEFDVKESIEINLYNLGISTIPPEIESNFNGKIVINNQEIEFIAGRHSYTNLLMKPGNNIIKIYGTGHIKILFHEELI